MRAAAGQLHHLLAALDIGDGRKGVAVVKEVVLALDLQNVGMTAGHPEGPKASRLGHRHRGVVPDPGKGVIHAFSVGIGLGIDDGVSDIERYRHGAFPFALVD